MGLFNKREQETIILLGPTYKYKAVIMYTNRIGSDTFDIVTHRIRNGFLELIMSDRVKYIPLSLIRCFDVIREEIPDEKARADS